MNCGCTGQGAMPSHTTRSEGWITKMRKNLTMRAFRCSENMSEDDDRIDHDMFKILSVMDSPKSLASIAFACGMSMSDFQKSIKALIELDLILPIEVGETIAE